MMTLTVSSDDLQSLTEELRQLEWRVLNLLPLAQGVEEAVRRDTYYGAMNGLDRDGRPYASLRPATWAWHPDRGPGPPLAPDELASRIATAFQTDILDTAPNDVTVRGSWPGFPELVFHITGWTTPWGYRVPPRNPVGVRPEGWGWIEAEVDRYLAGLLGGV